MPQTSAFGPSLVQPHVLLMYCCYLFPCRLPLRVWRNDALSTQCTSNRTTARIHKGQMGVCWDGKASIPPVMQSYVVYIMCLVDKMK